MEVKLMSDNEIKLTNKNNTTKNGTQFPSTPKPQVLKENFASVELNNLNKNANQNNTNKKSD